MLDDIDFANAHVYAIPMTTRFRGITVREGVLLQGPAGWAEFCPFDDYDDQVSASWLATAVEQCAIGWPAAVRDKIPINCTVPVVGSERAYEIARDSGCTTAKIKVADHPHSLAEDIARVEAVRSALGPDGRIRVDANGVWDVDTAVKHINLLDKAAAGLEYVEQPCRTIEELALVRARVNAPIAADESIRRAEDPMRVAVAGAADVAVIKCTPLGGVRRALRIAEAAGLPCAVSSALETSIGLGAQLALAGALPHLDYACGLGTLSLLRGDVVDDHESLRPVNGFLPVPSAPLTANFESLEEFRQQDADRVSWWLNRLDRVRAVLASTPELLPRQPPR